MVLVNQAWSELTGISSPKLNAMTIVAYTGAEISSLTATAIDGQVVYCYSSGSGYTEGHWYGFFSGDWIDLVMLPSAFEHFTDTMYSLDAVVLDRRVASLESYYWDNSGTGSDVNTNYTDNGNQWIQLETGTTTTGWAVISAGGILLDWGQPAFMKVKFKTSTGATTGQINKLGINIDRAGTGPSTRRNIGIEWCDGDSSFMIHSGNGTSQSNFDTNITVTTDSTWSVEMWFDPGNEIRCLFDDGTTETEKVKTTFVPSSGASTEDGIMKFSISNNNSNTTSRQLRIRGAYLVYNTNDTHWT